MNEGLDALSTEMDNVAKAEKDPHVRRLRAIEYVSNTVPVPNLSDCPASQGIASFATPVFLGHDMQDMKARTAGEKRCGRNTLICLGLDVTWKGYEGLQHWYKMPREIEDISKFW